MSDWIRVEDRSPEDIGWIIVATRFGDVWPVQITKKGQVINTRYYTHWMPLPEPPQENSDESDL